MRPSAQENILGMLFLAPGYGRTCYICEIAERPRFTSSRELSCLTAEGPSVLQSCWDSNRKRYSYTAHTTSTLFKPVQYMCVKYPDHLIESCHSAEPWDAGDSPTTSSSHLTGSRLSKTHFTAEGCTAAADYCCRLYSVVTALCSQNHTREAAVESLAIERKTGRRRNGRDKTNSSNRQNRWDELGEHRLCADSGVVTLQSPEIRRSYSTEPHRHGPTLKFRFVWWADCHQVRAAAVLVLLVATPLPVA